MMPGTIYASVISQIQESIEEIKPVEEMISAGSAVKKLQLSENHSPEEITALLGLDSTKSDPERNAGLESSGLAKDVYEAASSYHGNENILNRQLTSLKSELKSGNVSEEDFKALETLICSGYTYRQARAAIVSSETLGLSLDFLCEAKISSLTEEEGQYSELATKLGLPENAVAHYMDTTRALSEDVILSQFEQAMELQYGGEEEPSVSVMATSDTPAVQYSPMHILDNPYDYQNYGNLDVNLASGSYRYSETDLSIPGIRGLDLNFTRIYDSKFAYSQVPYGVSTGSYLSSYTLLVGMDIYVTYDFDNYEGLTLVSNPEDYYIQADEKYGDAYEKKYRTQAYSSAVQKYQDYLEDVYGALYVVTDPDGDDAVAMLQPYIIGIGNFEAAFEQGKTPYDYLVDEFGLGHGWRLGFSAVERVYSITEDDVYWNLILSDGSVYRMEKNKQPEGLPGHLTFDWSDTTYTGSKYSLKHADGKVEYFDSNGRNIAIVDCCGNTIKLEYTTSGDEVTQIKITDTVGNVVLYKQEVVENLNEDGYAVIEGYSESESEHDMIWSLNLNGERLKTYYIEKADPTDPDDIRTMKMVKDEVGDYYQYTTSAQPREFNCFVLTPTTNDGEINYACLGKVKYPDKSFFKMSYGFTTTDGNVPYERFNGFGYQECVQLIDHYRQIPVNQGEDRSEYNRFRYEDHSGFSTLWNEGTEYKLTHSRQHIMYDDEIGGNSIRKAILTEYVFNDEYELRSETVTPYIALQEEHFPQEDVKPQKMTPYSVTTYTYNEDHLPTKITMKTYEPVLATETAPTSYASTVQKYTYDSKGNVLTETAPNGMVTTYTYDSTYNHLLTKTYPQDETTTIKETNTLTESKKSIAQTVVTSNDTVVEKIKNVHNTKGQLMTKKVYSSDSLYLTQSITYGGGAQPIKITTKGLLDAQGETVIGSPGTSDGSLTEKFTYNDRGWLLTQTDHNGNTTSMTYDGTGRITQVTHPDGGKDTYVYDTINNTVRYTDTNDHTLTYQYDYFGHLVEIFDEEVQTELETYQYDSFGNRIRETIHSNDSTKDKATYYYYDSIGRLIESGIRNSDGTDTPLETYTYTANSRKTTQYLKGETGAPEQRTITTLDKMGNVIQIGRRLSGTTYNDKYAYDNLGYQINNQTTYSRWKGDTYTNVNTYDHKGNLQTSQDAQGNTITNTYDLAGNLLTTTDAKGNVTTYTYDLSGRMLTVTTPIDAMKSSIVKYTYDPNGNVIEQQTGTGTAVTDGLPANFTTIRYTYDKMNRLTAVEQVIDETTSDYSTYTYDKMGNLLTSSVGYMKSGDIISGTPSVTTYTYDRSGNILTMTDPLGKTETYTYDINGNVLTKTDRNGITTTYTYDNRGRLTKEVIGSGDLAITRTRTYAKNGLLLTLSEGNSTISYVYDEWGRLIQETSGTQVKDYTYDRGSLRTSFTLTEGDTVRVSNTYTYDNLSRLTGVTGADGTTAAYTYDANSNLSKVTGGNGITQTYTYNKADQITNLVGKKGTTTVSSYAYTYDLAGRMLQ